MKKRNKYPGASIRNTNSELPSFGKWFKQKSGTSNLQYGFVYQMLDELTEQGYTPLQIEEIMKLGLEQYKKK